MPKTEEDLRESRENRERVIRDFGCVPESILLHNKSDKSIDIMVEDKGRDYGAKAYKGVGQGEGAHLDSAFTVSGMTCRGEGAGLSRFPQTVGRILLKLYTKIGDTVVDPFAGHNSRMELCWRAGRNYIGHDLSHEFMEANRKIALMLEKERTTDMFPDTFSKATIQLFEGDSRKLQAGDAVGDFTITSPPYWCVEWYGDEPEQLGKQDYNGFLDGMQQVINENFRCLKPGAFCVYCINDFRIDGKFYSYHEDTANLLRSAGFYQWDIAITDLGSSFGAAFAQQVVDRKILPKRHEYNLIYRKPENGAKIIVPKRKTAPISTPASVPETAKPPTTEEPAAKQKKTQPEQVQQEIAPVATGEQKPKVVKDEGYWKKYWQDRNFHRDESAISGEKK